MCFVISLANVFFHVNTLVLKNVATTALASNVPSESKSSWYVAPMKSVVVVLMMCPRKFVKRRASENCLAGIDALVNASRIVVSSNAKRWSPNISIVQEGIH